MEKITVNTKSIVSKLLEEKRRTNLNECFIPLRKIKDKNIYLEECFNMSIKLLNEGYTEQEVNEKLVSEFELPTSLGLDKIDYKKMAQDTSSSFLKELAIDWILRFMGVSPGWSTTMSQALADLNPLDLIRIFKDKQSCAQHSKDIADTVLEVSFRAGASKIFGNDRNNANWSGMPSSFLGNAVGEGIKQSNAGEKIGGVLCSLIHK
jgi:hypothetical protein